MGKAHSNLFFYPAGISDLVKPGTAMYVDQDPAGLMAYQSARTAEKGGAGLVILSIQNILKRYPLPFQAMQRYVFDRAASALAVSRECEETIRKRGFERPVDIFNFGYDLEPLSPGRRAEVRATYGITGIAIGYVGRLVPEKGIDVLLQAVATTPDVTCVVGGDGPLAGELRDLAGHLGIADRTVFTGNLSPERALDVIGSLDVCVLPSRTRDNWKEQFGRVVVEAMGLGVVAVGSSSGAIPDTIGNAGLIFRENDVADLARALRAAIDPAVRDGLLEAGFARVRDEYSVDAVTDVLEHALERSIGSPR
jgi:glycosyltransferase involved in cell wall biosynthesis